MSRTKAKNKRRIIIAFLFIMLAMVVLLFRMAWIQVIHSEDYTQKAIDQQMSDSTITADRGVIYDKNGNELATSTQCFTLHAMPALLTQNYKDSDLESLSQKLAVILDQKATDIKKNLTAKQTSVRLARYLDTEQCTKIRKLKINDQEIKGLELTQDTKRYYPLGTSAAQLLGSVTSDGVGRTGVEAQFDDELSGIAGRWIKETDLNGDTLSYGSQRYFKQQDGNNLHLTIDAVLQHYAETAIADARKKSKADRYMCMVMNPKTGDILAMATNPAFDPNDATEPVSAEEKKKFEKLSGKAQTEYLSKMWTNPLVSSLYEPGSTFKLITTGAALEEGLTKPDEKFYDSGAMAVGDVVLHCWNKGGHGNQTLVEAIGNSCNTVQIRLGARLGKDKFYNYLEMFGITDTTGVALPAETSAIIKDKDSLTDVDLATMSFGQSIALTPIQLLTAVCAIGNDGVMMQPRIATKLTDQQGETVKTYETKKVRQVISTKTANELKECMEYVVDQGGGHRAQVAGYRIGGKTGTADKVVNGRYSKDTYSSFVGMAPMEDPQLAIIVIADSPKGNQYGSATAAPVAGEFFKKALTYMEISPKYADDTSDKAKKKIVYVEDLKGKTVKEAENILKGQGLKMAVSPEGAEKENFKIVDQYPKAGSKLTKGDTVYVYKE